MVRRKQYGQSRVDACPFCGSQATSENEFGVPVCRHHTKADMPPLRCFCGDWLDVAKGKWGPYFSCMRCGNISWSKGLEANPGAFSMAAEKNPAPAPSKEQFSSKPAQEKNEKKEVTVRSDDPEWF